MYGILLKAPQFRWQPDNKGVPYPYICASNCEVGYTWQKEAKKCVKIVRNTEEKKTFSHASVQCASEQARLLSTESCNQMQGLQNDLWFKYPGTHEKYWIGMYSKGLDFYTDRTRSQEIPGRVGQNLDA